MNFWNQISDFQPDPILIIKDNPLRFLINYGYPTPKPFPLPLPVERKENKKRPVPRDSKESERNLLSSLTNLSVPPYQSYPHSRTPPPTPRP